MEAPPDTLHLDLVLETTCSLEESHLLVWPVTVDIPTNTRVRRHSLTILSPKSISGLGVDEAVWVYNGEHIEIIFVDKALDLSIGGIV